MAQSYTLAVGSVRHEVARREIAVESLCRAGLRGVSSEGEIRANRLLVVEDEALLSTLVRKGSRW